MSALAGWRRGCPFGGERVEREPFLGGPPPIDGGLADAGAPGDVVHAHRVEALVEQEVHRGRPTRLWSTATTTVTIRLTGAMRPG